jgi:uncharacterized protein with PIN domain
MLCRWFHGHQRRRGRRLRCPYCGELLQKVSSGARPRIPTAPASPYKARSLHSAGGAGAGSRVEGCGECNGPLRRQDEPPGYDPEGFGLCWLCDAASAY